MGLAAGQSLSFYELLGPLGAGGMGEVWRARDTRLGREVALKVLPERFASDEERLRRFEREARTLAALQHPNIAAIFGIDQVGDTCATWSRDGSKLVTLTYDARWEPDGLAQYEIDPDGGARRLDWSAPEFRGRLASIQDWSPDGKRVLASGGDADPGLFVIDVEQGTRLELLGGHEPGALQGAAWLPDGRRFLLKVVDRILLVDAETGAETPVHEIERDSGSPWGRALSLSRDGRMLAFLERQGEGDVWMMDLEESAD